MIIYKQGNLAWHQLMSEDGCNMGDLQLPQTIHSPPTPCALRFGRPQKNHIIMP